MSKHSRRQHTRKREDGRGRHGVARALLTLLRTILALAVVAATVVGGYGIYLESHYARIPDDELVQTGKAGAEDAARQLEPGREYTAATYNIGFGAYTPDYTFFMDEGRMADGTPTRGTSSVATSRESVEACTQGDVSSLRDAFGGEGPDFVLLQEVDVDSDRIMSIRSRRSRGPLPGTSPSSPRTSTPASLPGPSRPRTDASARAS